MDEDVTSVVDSTVEALCTGEARTFVEGLRDLSAFSIDEVYADLFGLIDELVTARALAPLPETDIFGAPGVESVVAAIQAQDLNALLAQVGTEPSAAITKLLGVAAALKTA